MIERGKLLTTVAATAVLGAGLVACGDDSGSSATAPPPDNGGQANETSGGKSGEGPDAGRTETSPGTDDARPGAGSNGGQQGSGGGVEQFVIPGGDNSVQEFGEEAEASELDEAAAALHAFLDARAAADWATACDHLADGVQESFEQLAERAEGSRLRGATCAQLMATLSGPETAAGRKEAAIADVGAMRVEGDRAFLLYHGARKVDYAIPMLKEDDGWKVGSMAGVPIS